MFNMLAKLQEAKQKMAEIKARLETVFVTNEKHNTEIKIECSGNRTIKSVQLSKEFLQRDTVEVERVIHAAMNDVLEKANAINDNEMKGTLKGMLPNIPGLF